MQHWGTGWGRSGSVQLSITGSRWHGTGTRGSAGGWHASHGLNWGARSRDGQDPWVRMERDHTHLQSTGTGALAVVGSAPLPGELLP